MRQDGHQLERVWDSITERGVEWVEICILKLNTELQQLPMRFPRARETATCPFDARAIPVRGHGAQPTPEVLLSMLHLASVVQPMVWIREQQKKELGRVSGRQRPRVG